MDPLIRKLRDEINTLAYSNVQYSGIKNHLIEENITDEIGRIEDIIVEKLMEVIQEAID